jgi:acyl-CoA reductase-like NAD-dependent aldehyde dehydrogenase
VTTKVAHALAAGCTAVPKPSKITPSSAYLLIDAAREIGLPDGVINLVPGDGPTAARRSLHTRT